MRLAQLAFLLIALSWAQPIQATEGLELLRFDPDRSIAKVYHSFKAGFLLISLEDKSPLSFSCAANRYLIYQNGPERLSHFQGGNLRISSDFSQFAYLKIHRLSSVRANQAAHWTQKAKALVTDLQTSPASLSASAMIDSKAQCWQEPVLVRASNLAQTPLKTVAANLCKTRWCSELQFTAQGNLRLWVQSKPKSLQLVEFQPNGVTSVIQKSTPFKKPKLKSEHAPRENLLAGKDFKNAQIPLASGGRLILRYDHGKVIMFLLRRKPNLQISKQRLQEAQQSQAQRRYKQAFEQASFAAWLNPSDFKARYQKLVSLAGYAGVGPVFKLLERDFTKKERKKGLWNDSFG